MILGIWRFCCNVLILSLKSITTELNISDTCLSGSYWLHMHGRITLRKNVRMWEKLIWLKLGIMEKSGLRSSMWDFVFECMVPDVSKRDIAFVFKGQALFYLDCLTPEDEGNATFRNVGPHYIQKTWNVQHLRRENYSGGDHKPWGFATGVALPDILSNYQLLKKDFQQS